MSLKKKVLRSFLWAGISSFSTQGVIFITSIILARLLLPEEFGLVATSLTIITVLFVISELGFWQALMHRQDDLETAANTAFLLTLLASASLSALVFLLSPLIASFFNSLGLVPVIRALSVTLIFSSIERVPSSLLEKNFRFKTKLIVDLMPQVIYAVTTICFALAGFKVWSLVIGRLTMAVVRTMVVFRLSSFRLSLSFDRKIAWELIKYGQPLVYTSLLVVAASNLDRLFIAKFITLTDMAFYTMSFSLCNLPVANIKTVINRVMLPTYCFLQDDTKRLGRTYLRTVGLTAKLTFPAMFGLFSIAPILIPVLFKSEWSPMIPLMRLWALNGFFAGLGLLPGNIFIARGKQAVMPKVMIIQNAVLVLAIYPLGSLFDSEGVVAANTIALAVSVLLNLFLANKYLGLSLWQFLGAIKIEFLSSLGMALCISHLLRFLSNSILSLATLIIVGAMIYFIILYFLSRGRLIEDIREIRLGLMEKA